MKFLKWWRGDSDSHAQRFLLILVLAVVSLLAWAALAEVEQSARTTGQIIASSRTQLIQASNEGVIERIEVQEGQQVKKGALLVSLESAQTKAAVEESRAKVAALQSMLLRLQAEVFSHPLVYTAELTEGYPAFVDNQKALFDRRQRALNEEIKSLNRMLVEAQRELKISAPLIKKGDIAETEVIRMRRSIAELEGSITNRRNRYFQDAQAEMTKAEEDLATQQQILLERTTNLERTKLHAPADGLVRNIRITTLGGKVRPGDVVMELFPTDSELIVESKLKPADLAFVKVGQAASVKLDAYDYAIFGVLRGVVTYVSPDALSEDTRNGEHIYYRVRVKVDTKQSIETKGGKKLELQPGMTVQCEIRTGAMSVLNYIAKPIVKTFTSSFSER
jgi:adhesin transport system membrane fusion protein